MTDLEKEFLKCLGENDPDPVHAAAYHDWLIDQGRPLDAEAVVTSVSSERPKDFNGLRGHILTKVEVNETRDEILFTVAGHGTYKMYHSQSCCESVSIDDICGDWNDLIGLPLFVAEETSECSENPKDEEYVDESYTWTFYRLGTARGFVTIRWYGSSNGYYSESVDFRHISEKGDYDW